MSENKRVVERYMEGFRRSDHAAVLECLTDDVEWVVPGAFHLHGKREFDREIVGAGFEPKPEIAVRRLTEENDVVIAEGSVRTRRTTGDLIALEFCDVFEMEKGKVRRLISYLMQVE